MATDLPNYASRPSTAFAWRGPNAILPRRTSLRVRQATGRDRGRRRSVGSAVGSRGCPARHKGDAGGAQQGGCRDTAGILPSPRRVRRQGGAGVLSVQPARDIGRGPRRVREGRPGAVWRAGRHPAFLPERPPVQGPAGQTRSLICSSTLLPSPEGAISSSRAGTGGFRPARRSSGSPVRGHDHLHQFRRRRQPENTRRPPPGSRPALGGNPVQIVKPTRR